MFKGETINTNFIVFCLAWPGFKPVIDCIWGEQIQSKKKKLNARPGVIAVLSSPVGVIGILLSRCGQF